MTEKLTELAIRLIQSPHFRPVIGMAMLGPMGQKDTILEFREDPRVAPHKGRWTYDGRLFQNVVIGWAVIPDLEDYGTRGHLLGLVRKRWNEETLTLRFNPPVYDYRVYWSWLSGCRYGCPEALQCMQKPSEVEALVEALIVKDPRDSLAETELKVNHV